MPKNKKPRQAHRVHRTPTAFHDQSLGQPASSPVVSTGVKVAMGAAAIGLAYLGYKEYKKATGPKVIALTERGKMTTKTRNRPGGSSKDIKLQKPLAPTIFTAPKGQVIVDPSADPANFEAGDWESTKKVMEIIDKSTEIYKQEKAGTRKVAGMDTLPGDMAVQLYDHESKSRTEIMFTPWRRPDQIEWRNIVVGHKDRSNLVSDALSTDIPSTIALLKGLDNPKYTSGNYYFFGDRNKPFERFLKTMLGIGDVRARVIGQSNVFIGKKEDHALANINFKKRKNARDFKRVLNGSNGPALLDNAEVATYIRMHGDKCPNNLQNKIWALDRFEIGEERRNIFEKLYFELTQSYPAYICGTSTKFGGPLTGFYHAIVAEENFGEYLLEHVLPLIADVVSAILTICAIFTAGATLLVSIGLKVLTAAVNIVSKFVEIVGKVMSFITKAVAFVTSGLDLLAGKGIKALTDSIAGLANKGSIASEGRNRGESAKQSWVDSRAEAMDKFRGNDGYQKSADMMTHSAFNLDRSLKKLRRVAAKSETLYNVEKVTMFYLDPE